MNDAYRDALLREGRQDIIAHMKVGQVTSSEIIALPRVPRLAEQEDLAGDPERSPENAKFLLCPLSDGEISELRNCGFLFKDYIIDGIPTTVNILRASVLDDSCAPI